MKRLFQTVFFILLLSSFLLSGCSTDNFNIDQSDITKIEVNEFQQFGSASEQKHVRFEKQNDIDTIVDAINTASKEEGVVDMSEGDYDLLFHFDDDREEGFHLWLSEDFPQGTVMDIKDTHTIYTLSRTDTKAMQELIHP